MKPSPREKSDSLVEQLSQNSGVPLSKETFCILPFTQLSTYPTGDIKLCCRGESITSIKDETIKQFWNGEKLKQIQTDLTQGVQRKECENCWKLEREGVPSLREIINTERIPDLGDNINLWAKKQEMPLTSFELKLSNRCNLRCKICNPAASSRWVKAWPQLKGFYETSYVQWIDGLVTNNDMTSNPYLDLFMGNKNFLEDFTSIASTVRIVDFAGGEPLIDPLHYETLKILIRSGQSKNTVLRYSTNLTILAFEKFDVLDLWDQFKSIELTVSIDGFHELNEYIREGTLSSQLEKNIEQIKSLKKVSVLKGATTLNAYNALFVSETIHYIAGTLGIPWFVGQVTEPSFLDARVWPSDQLSHSINNLKNINIDNLNLEDSQHKRLQRLIENTISWLQSPLDNKDELFEKFQQFTAKSDKLTGKSFKTFISSQQSTEHF